MALRQPSFGAMLAIALLCVFAASGSSRSAVALNPGDVVTPAPLPADTQASLFRAELGAKFDPATLPQLAAAHDLLEQFFAATSAVDRKKILQQINSTNIDPAVLGRIARLRANWGTLAGGVYYIKDTAGPHDVRYFLGVPKTYTPARTWPLVVKLPAANGFSGLPDAAQVTATYETWINDELVNHPDALVLMPLLNLDDLYGPSPSGMNDVIQPILHAAGKVNIDPARVYMIGHSMGAHAVWNIALHYPTYFAAINPMAGAAPQSWQRVRLGNLRNILPVVWHDASDPIIGVDQSRELVRYLRNMKYTIEYNETKDIGHAPTPQIIADEYTKLRSRTRELYPRTVFLQSNHPDTIFNRADWVQIYQPISAGKEQKIIFERGTQGILVEQNSSRAIAEITGPNSITLTTANVESLRIYLNDQMVDLSKPVKITANGHEKLNAIVPQSIEEMLKDQIFLGRGWRYFTAVVDLDLLEAPPPNAATSTRPSSETASQAPPTTRRSIQYTTPDGELKTYTPGETPNDTK